MTRNHEAFEAMRDSLAGIITSPFRAGFCFAILSLSAAILPRCVMAQVSVDRVIVSFAAADRPVQNVIVNNGATEPLLISISVNEVENPGRPDERRVPTEDLIVSPKRFSIEAGGQRTVRLLMKRAPTDTERVYRAKLEPQANELNESDPKNSSDTKTKLKVLFSVGMLLFAEPRDPKPMLTWDRRSSGGLSINNTGNVNILLEEGQSCERPDESCTPLRTAAQRVYPGQSWEVSVPSGRFISFRKKVKEQFETLVIPP